MLETLSKREKNLVNLLLACVLIALIYWGFGQLLFPKYGVAATELETKKVELAQTKAQIERLPAIEGENKKLTEEADILKEPMNKEVRRGINYYYIGKHAVDTNMVITQVEPKPIEDDQAILKIPFDIKVRGNYQDLLKFLNLVEHDMPNTTELLSIHLQPYVEGKVVDEASEDKKSDPIIAGNNPEVAGILSMVTYTVKTPENMQLAQGITPLGRFDAFAPTVDVSKGYVEVEETEELILAEDEVEKTPVVDNIIVVSGNDKGSAGTSAPKGVSSPKEVSSPKGVSNPSVEEVIIKETGSYSFPIRE